MVNKKFLDNAKGKFVHIDFINDKNFLEWIEGTFDYSYDEEEEEFSIEVFTNTDFNKISEKQIRKIYIKENEKN